MRTRSDIDLLTLFHADPGVAVEMPHAIVLDRYPGIPLEARSGFAVHARSAIAEIRMSFEALALDVLLPAAESLLAHLDLRGLHPGSGELRPLGVRLLVLFVRLLMLFVRLLVIVVGLVIGPVVGTRDRGRRCGPGQQHSDEKLTHDSDLSNYWPSPLLFVILAAAEPFRSRIFIFVNAEAVQPALARALSAPRARSPS